MDGTRCPFLTNMIDQMRASRNEPDASSNYRYIHYQKHQPYICRCVRVLFSVEAGECSTEAASYTWYQCQNTVKEAARDLLSLP
jgi:hypothetical protein